MGIGLAPKGGSDCKQYLCARLLLLLIDIIEPGIGPCIESSSGQVLRFRVCTTRSVRDRPHNGRKVSALLPNDADATALVRRPQRSRWRGDGGRCVQERLMEASDAFRVHVDTKSGLLAAANLKNQTFTSLTGNKSAEIVQVYMPYACKLLFQEMMAMCIVPRMRFDEVKGER